MLLDASEREHINFIFCEAAASLLYACLPYFNKVLEITIFESTNNYLLPWTGTEFKTNWGVPNTTFQGNQNTNRGRFLKDLHKKNSSLTLDFYLNYIK